MDEKKEKTIKNVKRGTSVMAYVGAAGLMKPIINKGREERSGAMQACTSLAGIAISFGIGRIASEWIGTAIDKVVNFIDDVKPKKKETEESGGEKTDG